MKVAHGQIKISKFSLFAKLPLDFTTVESRAATFMTRTIKLPHFSPDVITAPPIALFPRGRKGVILNKIESHTYDNRLKGLTGW